MKQNINLGDSKKFVGYKTSGETNCLNLCKKILANYGLNTYGSSTNVIQLMCEKNGKLEYYSKSPQEQYIKAIKIIDNHLENKRPIIVGVNHTLNRGINEGSTDHFVVIYGRGYDESLKTNYYNYYEVGKGNVINGYNDETNRFYYIDSEKPLFYDQTSERGNKARFDVTQIRPNDGTVI